MDQVTPTTTANENDNNVDTLAAVQLNSLENDLDQDASLPTEENMFTDTSLSNDMIKADASEVYIIESVNVQDSPPSKKIEPVRCCYHDCRPDGPRPHEENKCCLHRCRPTWTREQREKAHGA